ncbi:MAG: DEAD/DEAH box helicase [Promethearchaeota archaeon]
MIQSYVNWNLVKKNSIKERKYQLNIVESAFMSNSLVVLPTALGKTIIGILLAAKHLKKYNGKVLVLAPTRPLVSQHFESFRQFLDDSIEMEMLIGGLTPLQRALKVNNSQIVFTTPQIIKNDITNGAYDLKNFTLIIFDEAHHARMNYAYTFIADEYIVSAKNPHIIGLTASPGKDLERINNLIEKLRIEKVCIKTEEDSDVREYIYPIDLFIDRVNLPIEIVEIQVVIDSAINEIVQYLINHDLIPVKRYYSKIDFLMLSQDIRMYEYTYTEGESAYNFPGIAYALNSNPDKIPDHITMIIAGIYWFHLQELLTTQSPQLFLKYHAKLYDRAMQKSVSAQKVVHSKYFKQFIDARISVLENTDSPKISSTLNIIESLFDTKPDAKVIVFTQFRDMATIITDRVNQLCRSEIKAARFVGQASKFEDMGLSQSMQQQLIRYFKNHEVSVLVATSIAEEGLDIPNVDCVIFYEPVPSEIRLIQRRGRTGRSSRGICHIMCANDTLDDIFLNVAFRKEQKMKDLLITSDQIELYTAINRKPGEFVKSVKKDSEIYQFFRDIAERRRLTTQKEIDLVKSLANSDAELRRISELKKFGVNDLTQELGSLSIKRLQKKDINLQLIQEEKRKTQYAKRKQKIDDKIKSLKACK